MLNSPSIPPSPTSTPEPRSEVDETDLRPVDEIRADLGAIAQGVGIRGRLSETEAAHRLLADVEPLLAALAAVERERDEARRIGRLDWQEANNLLVWAEGAEERVNAAVARAEAAERERDEATENGRWIKPAIAARHWDAIVRAAVTWPGWEPFYTAGSDGPNDGAMVRFLIAEHERAVAAEARLTDYRELIEQTRQWVETFDCDCFGGTIDQDPERCDRCTFLARFAALAAPSPQAEPARCHHGKTEAHDTFTVHMWPPPARPVRCPGPQSTEETQP